MGASKQRVACRGEHGWVRCGVWAGPVCPRGQGGRTAGPAGEGVCVCVVGGGAAQRQTGLAALPLPPPKTTGHSMLSGNTLSLSKMGTGKGAAAPSPVARRPPRAPASERQQTAAGLPPHPSPHIPLAAAAAPSPRRLAAQRSRRPALTLHRLTRGVCPTTCVASASISLAHGSTSCGGGGRGGAATAAASGATQSAVACVVTLAARPTSRLRTAAPCRRGGCVADWLALRMAKLQVPLTSACILNASVLLSAHNAPVARTVRHERVWDGKGARAVLSVRARLYSA